MVEVNAAAANSVGAARDIVDFCESLFSLNIGIEVSSLVGDRCSFEWY